MKKRDKSKLRCAVYTRKSTEDGLEQEFNSLDAQREACASFIASQSGLGWRALPGSYDDGGISGGTMDRPSLQRLLTDIKAGQIDIVVVYKIDRLTRSLMDFARMVEIFDQHEVSFVSVTQQFNTTSSMGRLTLNVLLSFAQFEREVTAERIRDKVAASKRKGMWMGGTVPFGYRAENGKLLVNEDAAHEVIWLYQRYLELGSVPALVKELNEPAIKSRSPIRLLRSDTGQGRRNPLKTIGKGKLYYMLANPIYTGKIRHGDKLYDGEHQPIIMSDLFAKVQTRLSAQAPRSRGRAVERDIHLLNGLVFDETGDRLSPVHANKAGKRYRYYISSRLKDTKQKDASGKIDGWRIPAHEIEAIVISRVKELMIDTVLLSQWLQEEGLAISQIEMALAKAAKLALDLKAGTLSVQNMRHILRVALKRIELDVRTIHLIFNKTTIASWLTASEVQSGTVTNSTIQSNKTSILQRGSATSSAACVQSSDSYIVDLPLSIRKRRVQQCLVIDGRDYEPPRLDKALISALAKAHVYLQALTDGTKASRKDIAHRFKTHPEDVSRLLPLAFLSPKITQAILTGRQSADLSVRYLTREIDLPLSWAEQEALLAI